MKHIIFNLTAALLLLTGGAAKAQTADIKLNIQFVKTLKDVDANGVPLGYELEWADEFDGTKLNTSKWGYRTGKNGTSWQRPENVSVADGNLVIDLKKEPYEGMEYTGGGIISKFTVKYGYFEVRARLDAGYGWHESFWTTWTDDLANGKPEYRTMPRLEIDCFEQYADHGRNMFSYGAIEWYPVQGNVNRDFKTTGQDLSETYNTFGFEFTPDYLNYYFNGELLKTIDTREIPQHDQYLWLSCIANKPDTAEKGKVYFDYMRYYKISKENYEKRKVPFVSYLDSFKGPQKSNGTDLWIEMEDFINLGLWTKKQDLNAIVLNGVTGEDKPYNLEKLKATTTISVKKAGTYHLWVRSRDFAENPGTRLFRVFVNGEVPPDEFGKHGQEGYGWEYGGSYTLPKGDVDLILFDSSQYYARADKMLLTTDADFVPSGTGAPTNVKHIEKDE